MNFTLLDLIILPILTLVPLLITVAFFTLAERKIMASIQRRLGPNIVGYWGILQAFADGLKLIIKELIIPMNANNVLFILAPIMTLFLSFINWIIYPFGTNAILINYNYSLLYFLTISSLGIYGIFIAGWSSKSKYALLGSIRAIAQMISYEISISIILLPIIFMTKSFNLVYIVKYQKIIWFIVPLIPLSLMFFIASLAETNRAPFDLPEAEAELVAGYNIEYASILFAAFFIGEYANMILMSSLFALLFLGGWLCPNWLYFLTPIFLALKIVLICFLFIFIRSNLPRYRFDQLMHIGWKILLPLTFGIFLFYIGFLTFNNWYLITNLPLHFGIFFCALL